ncbi:MAG: trypsin-like peptidase domain-containing protein [Oscillospiraceae bacterium]|nr:trypsin-like peptidase domain-containing protein [Oscillospiraceae bacterium]
MYYNDYNRPPEDQQAFVTNDYHVHGGEPPQPPKKKHTGAKIAAACLVCALIGGAVGGGGAMYFSSGQNTTTDAGLTEGTRSTAAMTVSNVATGTLDFSQVYANNLASVVGVNGDATTNYFGQQVRNAVSGSGFVIRSDGYILTNYHVIDGVDNITVSFSDGTTYDATLVGGEQENDIAVLKIDATGLQVVTLGDSSALQVGEPVVAIGNPLGELTFTCTVGYVSAKDRSVTMSDGTVMNMLQTDAAINSGNSGGPLFDSYGQVVGIVSAKYSSSSTTSSASIEGIGFAIPISDVKDMVSDIITYGYVTGKPNVGIMMNDVSSSAIQYGIPEGAEVKAILSGSCAEKAGLQVGDIITAVSGTTVSDVTALKSEINEHKAGESVTFSIYRSGQTMEITLTLDESSQERQAAMDKLYEEYQAQLQQEQQQQQQQSGSYSFPYFGW